MGQQMRPALEICNEFHRGDLMDYDTVYNFGKKADLLTIEIEHVNIEALKKLKAEGLTIYPQPEVLELIQHKGRQKDFYLENDLPTAAFTHHRGKESLFGLSLPFVWKSAQFGYDGNGVKVIRTYEDLLDVPDLPCIAEKLIPFKNELAVIVARSAIGEIRTYPVVEMEFHPTANQVEYVVCPARIPEEIAVQAQEIALRAAEAFGITGLLAVEMFQTTG